MFAALPIRLVLPDAVQALPALAAQLRPGVLWQGLSGSTSTDQGVGRGMLKHSSPPGGSKGSHGWPARFSPISSLCMKNTCVKS